MLLACVLLAFAQRQTNALPVLTVQHRRDVGAFVRVPLAVPPAPANTTAVIIHVGAHLAGTTSIENTGAAVRPAGMWDVGVRVRVRGSSIALRARFDYGPLPGYACHGPNADGEFDGAGAAGRTWLVDHALAADIEITEPTAVALWRRAAADGMHHECIVLVPELDSSSAIFCRAGAWWAGDVAMDTGSVAVEYRSQ